MHIHERGKAGEQIAADYLIKKGFKILYRNYIWERKEIDLICLHAGVLIFVEVKTRSGKSFGNPEEAVVGLKQHAIVKAARGYLREFRHSGELRFDIVSVIIPPPPGETEIFHIQDAFFPGP